MFRVTEWKSCPGNKSDDPHTQKKNVREKDFQNWFIISNRKNETLEKL